MRFLSILFISCFLTMFSAQGQVPNCSNSIFTNGDLENGTTSTSHQDIGNAVGFSRIWAPASWADYYPATYAPAGYPTPAPATGNYASCWIANHAGGGITYREGFKAELDFTVPANTGTYTLTFDAACLGGWGNSEVAVYALHNPSNADAPNSPTGAFTPNNLALFGAANTQLIGVAPVSASSCSNTKTNYSFTINTNAASFPAGGMTHVFVTHSDNSSLSGALYMAFDNFCMPIKGTDDCPASWVVNGDIEDGVPTTSHQDIHLATGFDRIWNGSGLSYADYYAATVSPFPNPPSPNSGDYASCWIANYAGGGTTYREGFQTELVSTIPANTGMYQLTFDMACLGGWGNVEVAVYGINNASGGYSANPTGAYTPSNLALFGTTNTVLLGTVSVNSSNCSYVKTPQTVLIDSDASGFPASGMTHFFVTHSDNSGINGARYIAFDDFCLQSRRTVPCPAVGDSQAECDPDGNYIYSFTTTTTTGSVTLSSPCGTFSPSTVTLTGATSYSVTFIPNGSCGNNITTSYSISNSAGVDCDQVLINTVLPNCGGCQCDEDFFSGFMNFLYAEDCPNDIVYPTGVEDDCDRVDWHIDGNYVGSSTGTSSFSFPHINNSFQLCMTVTRTTANGKVCKREFCREITPRRLCGPGGPFTPLRLNVTPNPATTQISVSWDSPEMPNNVSITIFNSSSMPVKVLNDINSFDGNTQINIADLPTGMYYISVQGEGYISTPIKFIKK